MSCLALGGHTFLSSFGGTDRAAEIELLKILNASLDAGIHFLDVTYDEERETLGRGRFLQEHPSQATQMAGALLRFVFAHTGIDGTLLTMRSMDELKANVEMARGPKELTEEDREMLEKGKGYEIEFDPWK